YGGAISNSPGESSSIIAAAVALTAEAGIGTADAPLRTEVSTLAAVADAGGAWIHNTGDLSIGTVGSLAGVAVSDGDISVVTVGSLTVDALVTNYGTGGIVLNADTF